MRFSKQFLYPPRALCPQCHAATLCEVSGGALLAAFYAGTREKARDVAIYLSRRPRGGTWSEPEVLVNTPGRSEGNPVLCRHAGALWLFYVTMMGDGWDTCEVRCLRSEDEGRTWGEPATLHAEWGWMTSNKPLEMSDGALLLPLYEERGASFVLRTDDGGRNWQRSNVISTPQGVIQPALAPLSDGRLLMLLRTYERTGGTIWQSHSSDSGLAWSGPVRTALPNPNARVDVQALASGALLLAFNDTPEARFPLTLALSDDEGQTWPFRYHVESDPGEYSYPALLQSSDGLCHLLYTWRREAIAHLEFDEEGLRARIETGSLDGA